LYEEKPLDLLQRDFSRKATKPVLVSFPCKS